MFFESHPSVRPPSIRLSVSAFYPNPEKMLDARKNFRREKKGRREKKFQMREKMLNARKKFQTREKILDARKKSRNMKFERKISMALLRLRSHVIRNKFVVK
jgi:hypothetical protein